MTRHPLDSAAGRFARHHAAILVGLALLSNASAVRGADAVEVESHQIEPEQPTASADAPPATLRGPPPAPLPGPPPAPYLEQLLEQALLRYQQEDYAGALVLLRRLYALSPNPGVLYNLAATHAALRHCDEARHAYRHYLEQTRSESGRRDAERQLQALEHCTEAPPAATAGSQPPSMSTDRLELETGSGRQLSTGGSPTARSRPALADVSVGAAGLPGANAGLPGANAGLPGANAGLPGANAGLPTNATALGSSRAAPVSARSEMPSDPGVSGTRVAAWLALGAGGALAVASAGFTYASARADRRDEREPLGVSGDAAASQQEAGERYNALAWGFAGGAAALGVSGLLLISFEPSPQTSLSAGAASTPLGVTLDHAF